MYYIGHLWSDSLVAYLRSNIEWILVHMRFMLRDDFSQNNAEHPHILQRTNINQDILTKIIFICIHSWYCTRDV